MTPIRSILVHLDSSAASQVRLQVARALASQHGATVQALFAVAPMVALAAFAYPTGADFIQTLDDFDRDRRMLAKAQFDAHAGNDGLCQWSEADAEAIWATTQAALCADLLVLGQRDPQSPGNVPADFVESVITQSGKPALVLPYISKDTQAAYKVVLVAWKNSREAARALADAVPLLAKAEQVHLVSWQEDASADAAAAGPGAAAYTANPVAYLQRHGIRAQHHVHAKARANEQGQTGDLLLSLASDLQADLLVMGCYGHGRAREWVMGGASRTVLASMTLPVLMAH